MNYVMVGGNTKWSKILIKNFEQKKFKLKFTSSRYIKKKNNFTNYKKIPLNNIDFVVLCSDAKRNINAAKFFDKKKMPIFIEKPISNSFINYVNFKKKSNSKSIYFCNYLHIYSDPIKLLKKKINKQNILSIKLIFGKNGKERTINSSYEWLPHPLSVLFFLKNNNYNASEVNYTNFKNKKKTNIKIQYKKKNFNILIQSGNNFKSTKYIVEIITKKNNYFYDGTDPRKLKINEKIIYFKNMPLMNSINIFSKNY